MRFYTSERTAIFIDGANLNHTMRLLGWELDYARMTEHFAKLCHLVRSYYYTGINTGNDRENTLRGLLDFLSYSGYAVVTKPVKTNTNHETGATTRKGNMDVEMVVDMMRLAPALDHIILFTGDGDFSYLVQHLQEIGVRVTLVSTLKERVLSDELRRQCDNFIELDDLKSGLDRDANTRIKASLLKSKPADARQTTASEASSR